MFKSTDEKITTDLIETLRDGEKGFAAAAEKLEGTTRGDLAPKFRQYAAERGRFADELESLAAVYGDDIDEHGSAVAAAHRGWMAVVDKLTGDSPDSIVSAAATGEEHAVNEYRKALDEEISDNLRVVVTRQFAAVSAAAEHVQALEVVTS